MPSSIIFGGSGKVARHLTRLLVAKGHTVHSVIRNPAQSDSLASLGAKPVVQSIEDSSVSDLARVIRDAGATTVIWAAGAGGGDPQRTKRVDHEGAVKCMDAMVEATVNRFIIISAIDTRDRDNKPKPEWYNDDDMKVSDGMWTGIGAYMRAKLAADTDLRTGNAKRGLRYTIVRPGSLSEEEGTGKVSAGKVHLGAKVSREDVAAVVVACVENDGTVGLAFDVVGGDTAIVEAVKQVVDGHEDTFEGFYS